MLYRPVNDIFSQSFKLVKYNLVLLLPFFLFLLVAGFILLPISNISGPPPVFYALFVVPALFSVFLSGWLNMFKKCTEEPPSGETLPPDKRTEDSLLLFREFFPGVGKYFIKIALGVLIYSILFDLFMLMTGPVFTVLFVYVTMFWMQLLVMRDILPLRAMVQSFKAVTGSPVSTFIIFISGISLMALAVFINAAVSENPLFRLLTLILFVFAIVYYLMLTFLYIVKTGEE